MKIIIEVKDTATLSQIDAFSHALDSMTSPGRVLTQGDLLSYSDVIKSISKEW